MRISSTNLSENDLENGIFVQYQNFTQIVLNKDIKNSWEFFLGKFRTHFVNALKENSSHEVSHFISCQT